jgi:hypothetical protein
MAMTTRSPVSESPPLSIYPTGKARSATRSDAEYSSLDAGVHFVMDNFTINSVPEPSTLLLLGSGLLGLPGYGRRRMKE